MLELTPQGPQQGSPPIIIAGPEIANPRVSAQPPMPDNMHAPAFQGAPVTGGVIGLGGVAPVAQPVQFIQELGRPQSVNAQVTGLKMFQVRLNVHGRPLQIAEFLASEAEFKKLLEIFECGVWSKGMHVQFDDRD